MALLSPTRESIAAAAPPSDTILSFRDVGKTFPTARGPFEALRNVSFDVGRGEFVALIGHSGCGKSTLLNMVAGLDRPTSGAILVDGKSVARPGPERAMVFQNYSLLPWMSVRQNVYEAVASAFSGLSNRDKAEQTDRYLSVVGLTSASHKKPFQLSGGMRQRVAIARAFAVHPKVLLLDEPFGALDALTKAALHEQLVALWSHDRKTETVLMVTHDVDEAIYLADRVIVMTDGPSATVGQIVEIDLPRPRDKRAMVHQSAYADAKDRLLYLLTEAYRGREAAE